QGSTLAVSADGMIVDFGFEVFGASALRFNLRELTLVRNPEGDGLTSRPQQTGLPVEDWNDSKTPTLDGKPIALDQYETSRSLAITPDNTRFVLGSEWPFQSFDADGKRLWTRSVPAVVWAVNISGDGRLVVAAYDDGTIRWHRMDDGRELLALMVLS